jgi:hypothetical protein
MAGQNLRHEGCPRSPQPLAEYPPHRPRRRRCRVNQWVIFATHAHKHSAMRAELRVMCCMSLLREAACGEVKRYVADGVVLAHSDQPSSASVTLMPASTAIRSDWDCGP